MPVATAQVASKQIADVESSRCHLGGDSTTITDASLNLVGPAVVSQLDIEPGSAVTTGTVLAEVSGKPLVAVATSFPLWRDLSAGDQGPDVKGLEDGLVAADVLSEADETFDAATERALADSVNSEAARRLLVPTVRRASLVEVPTNAVVESVSADVGAMLADDSPILTLRPAGRYVCDVPNGVGVDAGDSLPITGSDTGEARVVKVMPPQEGKVNQQVHVSADSDSPEITVTITSRETPSKVLAVPLGALRDGSDGSTFLTLRSGDGGEWTDVPVTVGAIAGGLAQISGSVDEGDTVRLFVVEGNQGADGAPSGEAPKGEAPPS